MNCVNHPEIAAAAYCRTCGKPLCEACKREAHGVIYCQDHAPATGTAAAPGPTPYTAPDRGASAALAFIMGLIPGVGAIYNGQYGKGLIHAVIFGLLVSILNSRASDGMEPVFVVLLIAWIFYMAIEAYHTAKKRQMGAPVDELSSIVDLRESGGGFPTGAVVMIILGVILLLNTLELLHFERIIRYWPALLIFLGVGKLLNRPGRTAEVTEAAHDRQ